MAVTDLLRSGDTDGVEIEALRLIVLELARDLARRSPSPTGYLDSRRAAVLAGLDRVNLAERLALRRRWRLGRAVDGFFAEAAHL